MAQGRQEVLCKCEWQSLLYQTLWNWYSAGLNFGTVFLCTVCLTSFWSESVETDLVTLINNLEMKLEMMTKWLRESGLVWKDEKTWPQGKTPLLLFIVMWWSKLFGSNLVRHSWKQTCLCRDLNPGPRPWSRTYICFRPLITRSRQHH